MATELEDLRILKPAEEVADAVWKQVVTWDTFARDVVGNRLNRALARGLIQAEEVKGFTTRLSNVACQLNTFAGSLKTQRQDKKVQSRSSREPTAEYLVSGSIDDSVPPFTDTELNWLES